MPAPPITTANKLTFLGLVQQACNEMGILAPTSVIGNTDNQIIQLLGLSQREGKEFSSLANKNGGWQEMRQEHVFQTAGVGPYTGNTASSTTIIGLSSTTGITAGMVVTGDGIPVGTAVVTIDSATQVTIDTAATSTGTAVSLTFGTQSHSLPSDFGYFMTKTFWDRTYRWQMLGPMDAQEWQVLKSGISPTGPRRRFRIMGNYFYLDPVPSSVTTEVFEYYSNSWCQSLTGTAQTKWTADTDYYTLDDDCFILGLKWRFLRAKGLDYEEEYNTYINTAQRAMSRNGGNRDLPLNAVSSAVRLLNYHNVPDTGFGT